MTTPDSLASEVAGSDAPTRLIVTAAGLIVALGLVTASLLVASYRDTMRIQTTTLRNISIAFSAQTFSVAKAVDGAVIRAASVVRYRGPGGLQEVLGDASEDGALAHVDRLAAIDLSGALLASVAPGGGASGRLGPVAPPPGAGAGPDAATRITMSDIDPRTGRAMINFVRPLIDRAGGQAGWILAQVDSARFERLYSLVELGEGGSVTLFHRDGTMLVRGPAHPGGIGRSFAASPLFRKHLPRAAGGAIAVPSPLDGTPRLYGYEAVSEFPLVVIVGMNESAAMAAWYGRMWTTLGFFALLTAILAFLGARVLRDARRQVGLIGLLKASEARLVRRFDYLTAIINAVGAPIWVVDSARRIVMANEAFAKMVGQPRERLAGAEEQAVYHQHGGATDAAWQERAAGLEVVRRVQNGAGETRAVIQLTSSLAAETGEMQTVNVLTDITERERVEARLAYLADFDVLTGLPNQAQFWRALEARLATPAPGHSAQAMLALHFARLHEIGDLLGREASDDALGQIGDMLHGFVDGGTMVARVRGDEFAVLADAGAGRAAIERLALLLHERCSAPLMINGREFFLQPVLGAALAPNDASSAEELYRCAQSARAGHGATLAEAVYFYSADADLDLAQRLTTEAQLRRALERGELRLVFQPKVAIRGGEVVGFEALLRWSHPTLGEVSPAHFIPIAERTGLIVPIGAWVLEQACLRMAEWSRRFDRPIKIAVNLSPKQFYQKSLLSTIAQCLARHDIAWGSLELEITESALMSREEEVDRVMHDIRALGVELSIDDFGTGYSSLAYLKRFPVARLKIDRAFVRDLGRDEDSAAIASAIVSLARGLKLSVVAEGVETTAQLDVLRQLDCDQYQGFLFSRPLEPDAVGALLEQHACAQQLPVLATRQGAGTR